MFNICTMSILSLTENRKILFHRLLVCISLVWLGMILGISFLEAPLKLMTPRVTPEISLDIGRRVFGVFNKIECAMALAMAILTVMVRPKDRLLITLMSPGQLFLYKRFGCSRFYLTEPN